MKIMRPLFLTIAIILTITIAIGEHLADESQAISKVPTSHKVVALTIDDGPNNKVTPEILAIFREKKVKATFFVLGVNAEHSQQLLAQEVADGHEIGAHTYSHPFLPKLDSAKVAVEFDKAEKVISAVAPKPTLFRPPGGLYNPEILKTARQKGYTTVLWSIDPRDWSCPPTEKIVETILKEVKPGSIILLHDGQFPLPTPQALAIVIDRLRELGYEFVTVSELLQYNEVQHSFNLYNFLINHY